MNRFSDSRVPAWAYVFLLAFVSPIIGFAWVNEAPPAFELKEGSIRPNPASPLAANPNLFADLAERVVPSVVNILTRSQPTPTYPRARPFRRDLERYFGLPPEGEGFGRRPGPQGRGGYALGSGVVIESDSGRALVLTNLHVVDGSGTIEIQPDKSLGITEPLKGELIGADRDLDLALIGVDSPKKLPALPLGDSDKIRVGDYVMAVGNPFGQGHSVSHGIISAKERNAPSLLGHYLQTDAPINPGNSGGPLVSLRGEIIGINNAILAAAQGIGFAIPANEVKRVVADLKDHGKVRRAFLGIEVGALSDYFAGPAGFAEDAGEKNPGFLPSQPRVVAVTLDGPAASAGLRPNDILLEFNGKPVGTVKDFILSVSGAPIGSTARLGIWREGKKLNVEVRLRERPSA